MGWRSWVQRILGRDGPPVPPPAPPAPPAARGLGFALVLDPWGDDACVGCGLCAAACPVGAITVQPAPLAPSPHTGHLRGWVGGFTLDPRPCTACELCAQVCPTDALHLFPDPSARADAILDLPALRSAAMGLRSSRRRPPLGPMPGSPPPRAARSPAAAPPAAGHRPRPAPARGLLPAEGPTAAVTPPWLHLQETATDEPTRLEHPAHPEEAPTDVDSDLVAAVDPGEWDPEAWDPGEEDG